MYNRRNGYRGNVSVFIPLLFPLLTKNPHIYSFYFFTIFKVDTAHKCFTQEKLPELYLQFLTLIWEQGVGKRYWKEEKEVVVRETKIIRAEEDKNVCTHVKTYSIKVIKTWKGLILHLTQANHLIQLNGKWYS